MVYCVAFGCNNGSTNKDPIKSTISFHRFPKDEELRLMWMHAIKRKNWNPSNFSRICSDHFKSTDYDETSLQPHRLKNNAVPSLFNIPEYLKKQSPVKRRKIVKHTISYLDGGSLDRKRCDAYDCGQGYERGISFHKFPEDPTLLKKWLTALKWDINWKPSKLSQLCSKHFTSDDFETTPSWETNPILKKDAVPSIFNFPDAPTLTNPSPITSSPKDLNTESCVFQTYNYVPILQKCIPSTELLASLVEEKCIPVFKSFECTSTPTETLTTPVSSEVDEIEDINLEEPASKKLNFEDSEAANSNSETSVLAASTNFERPLPLAHSNFNYGLPEYRKRYFGHFDHSNPNKYSKEDLILFMNLAKSSIYQKKERVKALKQKNFRQNKTINRLKAQLCVKEIVVYNNN